MSRNILLYGLLAVLLAGGLLSGLRVGSFDTSVQDIGEAVWRYDAANAAHVAVVQLRLPRLLLAVLVGGSLAFCGYLMQALVNNALADPYILGTASGASLGASLSMSGIIATTWAGVYLPPFFALMGAFGVTVLVIALGYRQRQMIPSQLLLAGIAISSLLTALVSLVAFLSGSESNIKAILFWSMGDFGRANWDYLPYPAVALALALGLFSFLGKELNALLLGAARAHTLGVHVARTRWIILVAVSVLCGFAVALAGSVGFVGIIIPHVTRALLGVTHKNNLLVCAWLGGIFMLGCDILSQIIYPPAGLPIGIITSFFGVPFFVYLLLKKQYQFS